MRPRQIVSVLLVLLAMSFVGAVVYGKLGKPKPIHISFAQKPSKEVNSDEGYSLAVSWINKDEQYAYKGAFVFTVEGKKFQVESSDLTFVFQDSVLDPQVSADSLVYCLPPQTFHAEETGTITVEITYHNSGEYSWEVEVTKVP